MTTIQAGLSTILSLIVGVALAWALNRLRFPGRGLIIGLFASAIVTPGLIVAFGLLTVWGRAGWINSLMHLVGLQLEIPIFGLGGILAAHVILDGAFAARILLARLDALPRDRLRTGQSLGLGPAQRFAIIDWPAMRGTLPGLAAIIFLLAFTSFPIVLLLGGGPANQTLEVAIYAAVRLDFDLGAAVRLALVQVGLCTAIILAATAFAPVPAPSGDSRPGLAWRDRAPVRAVQWAVLLLGTVGFAAPLLATLVDGFGPGAGRLFADAAFWRATTTSLWVGAASAVLALALALGLGMSRAATTSANTRLALGVPAYAYLAVPAMVLALGFFLLVRGLGIAPGTAAAPVVILANALLSLPFAIATLGPPLGAVARTRGKLIRSLGLSGTRQFAMVEWPLLARDIGVVLALGFCFSLGDLGVISLFGTEDFATLPLLMARAMGAYRSNDAAAIAAVMLAAAILAFTVLPPLFARLGDARR
jgi:thiamine transport system permease protein